MNPEEAGDTSVGREYLSSLLVCGVCGQTQCSPKLLACLHSFCQACLPASVSLTDQDTESSHLQHGAVHCPTCQQQTTLTAGGLEAVKDNLWLVKLQDKLRTESQSPWVLVDDSNKVQSKNIKVSKSGNNLTELDEYVSSDNAPVLKGVTCYECRGNKIIEACEDIVNSAPVDDASDNGANVDEDVPDTDSETRYYCGTCDVILCKLCKDVLHMNHEVSTIEEASLDKSEYLKMLITETNKLHNLFETQLLQLDNSSHHLVSACETLQREIEERAANLIRLIEARKAVLLRELSRVQASQMQKYKAQKESVESRVKELERVCAYSNAVLHEAESEDILHLSAELSTSLMDHISQGRTMQPVEIINLRLNIPELGREDLYFDKSFGSVVKGVVRCGDADQLRTFNIDLTWPTGLAITRDHEFVITGKTGAFDKDGKVLFYNKSGQLLSSQQLPENEIPFDTSLNQAGHILVTNNCGQIIHYNRDGSVQHKFYDKFKGTGRLTCNSRGEILVCSSDDQHIYMYDQAGNLVQTFPNAQSNGVNLEHPHYITTNEHDDIIISDFSDNALVVLDHTGQHKFTYKGTQVEGGQLKCPSAVCCDSFNNILIADFMNDRIHLVSQSGQFLGYLLTKENGVSCPNFLTMDTDGHLFIGQYGGDINVFQYLSYMKFVWYLLVKVVICLLYWWINAINLLLHSDAMWAHRTCHHWFR